MDPTRSIERLRRIAAHQGTADDISWLADAASQYLCGRHKTMDGALALAPRRGQRRPWRAVAIAARRDALRYAYASFYATMAPSRAARIIRQDMTRLTPGATYQDPRRGLLSAISVHGTPSCRTIRRALTGH